MFSERLREVHNKGIPKTILRVGLSQACSFLPLTERRNWTLLPISWSRHATNCSFQTFFFCSGPTNSWTSGLSNSTALPPKICLRVIPNCVLVLPKRTKHTCNLARDKCTPGYRERASIHYIKPPNGLTGSAPFRVFWTDTNRSTRSGEAAQPLLALQSQSLNQNCDPACTSHVLWWLEPSCSQYHSTTFVKVANTLEHYGPDHFHGR